MPLYLTISTGPTPREARPLIESSDKRVVASAFAAVIRASYREVFGRRAGADSRAPTGDEPEQQSRRDAA